MSDKEYNEKYSQIVGEVCLVLVIYLIIHAIVSLFWACQYKSKVTEKRGPLPDGIRQSDNGDFATNIFGCLEDCQYCLHGWVCTSCRAGDTYQAAGIDTFWHVVLFNILAILAGNCVGGFFNSMYESMTGEKPQTNISAFVEAGFMGLIFYHKRRQLREKLGGSNKHVAPWKDFALWACCGCLVVMQEARELDKAMGVRVECCCRMTKQKMRQPLVGEGVEVSAQSSNESDSEGSE